jgi:hypothetical protein
LPALAASVGIEVRMTLRAPEILIVGVMRAGTTILFEYLGRHPHIALPCVKEKHYFSLWPGRGNDWYIQQFPDRPADVLSVDASPTYFDAANYPTIPAVIKAALPGAKLLLTVRDPVERAVSHFQHLRSVSEPLLFADVDINEFFSRPIEHCYSQAEALDYWLDMVLRFSLYYRKFAMYAEVVGQHTMLVVCNEELAARPAAVMQRVFCHCGLEWSDSLSFENETFISNIAKLSLDPAVRNRLEDLLYPDYQRFCDIAGIPLPVGMRRM